jgi:RNA polymerase sigma-70 factor, ECF subfamily
VRIVPGEAVVYEDLHRAHRERVMRLCRVLLVDPDEAADVVQDVFLKLHRARAVETRPMDWGAWLTRVAVNACRDRRRSGWWRRWRERGVALDELALPAMIRTPEDEVIGREEQRRVWERVRRLPARQREVLALRLVEGLATDETAAALGVSPGTVKRHLFRAVHSLRRALGEMP